MKRVITVLLLISALVSALPGIAFAETFGQKVLSTPRNYLQTPIFLTGGKQVGNAYYDPYKDENYCSISVLAEAAGVSVEESLGVASGDYWASGDEITLRSVAGTGYTVVNYRYFYTPGNFLVIDDSVCFKTEFLSRIFGFATEHTGTGEIYLTPTGEGIVSGEGDYYTNTFGKEDVKWLSRIIQAEAGGESLECKIAVGNVIFNRLEDPYFPNTIYKIVFQKDVDGTVQFTPAETGGINLPPSDESLIAAYLCFEGANTAGMSEFFVDPKKGDSSWFRNSLTYVVSYGNLDFYADPRRLENTDNGA